MCTKFGVDLVVSRVLFTGSFWSLYIVLFVRTYAWYLYTETGLLTFDPIGPGR